MKRTQTILMTTVILSIALTSVFAIDFKDISLETTSTNYLPFFYAEADKEKGSSIHHDIQMEAVKMPDGMYAYRMVNYTTSDGRDLVIHPNNSNPSDGVYTTKPSIPGPTLVFTEGDTVTLTLYNKACDDFVVDTMSLNAAGENENSLVGVHVHGVHYDISDDATYGRVNMNGSSAASCNSSIVYDWDVSKGTEGTWPYHDHTFKQNEVGAEDVGLFGTVIVNPSNGKVDGIVDSNGKVSQVDVDDINKEFVLWMVSSETLGRSVFYGMEIDNHHPDNPGKQTPLWINPPLYTEEGEKVRFHVLGIGDETHAFHLHGHRWVDAQGGAADIIDVKEITPLQRHTFLVTASDNDGADKTSGTEAWMYHCHVFAHMQAGMSGMMMVVDNDTLPDVGAVFTLSDEPGLWMKTLNAGIADDLDEVLASVGALPEEDTKAGIGFPLNYLGKALGSGFDDSEGRSLAVISPGETVLFNMKDSQTKHTITSLIYPTDAAPNLIDEFPGGNGILSAVNIGLFDTQLGIRGSSFITDGNNEPLKLEDEGLYVFVCKIHPYMFSAVIVDDPTTNVFSQTLNAPLPLLDFSDSLTVLLRSGTDVGSGFPTVIPPTDGLAKELLTDFYVITDPSNWKDYRNENFTVNVPPVLVTTNTEDLVVGLHASKDDTLALAGLLGIVKSDNATSYELDEVDGLALDVNVTINELPTPEMPGVGEIWVNTQFEQTVNKNHPGTPQDKPGTITVVDASTWKVKQKIALPEINMNHPHNMWTNAENDLIYQTQWFDSRMVVIDRETGEMIKDNFVGQSPSHVMTSPDTGKIYVAMNGEEQVVELDPTTYEVTRQISTGPKSHPHGHWISSDGRYIVTPDFISLSSSIIDLENNDVTKATHESGNDPFGLGIPTLLLGPIATGMTGDGEKYYTADFLGNTLSVVELDSQEIVKQIDLNGNGTGLPIQTPVSPDDKYVVTANVVAAKITVVDTDTDEITAVLNCDPGCHGVQWGAKADGGYYAYVSSKFSNVLIVVDPDPNGAGNLPDDGSNAVVAGMIRLDDDSNIDDPVIGYDGMGGQGVLAIPNVYQGWLEQSLEACDDPNACSEDVNSWLDAVD